MDAPIYNAEAKETGRITLPENLFGVRFNADLLNQVLNSMRSNARESIAFTKNRADVRGGGKKPWRQKGTGRARHGSIRSPLWRGGGVTFGPRDSDQNFKRKINKKIRSRALAVVFSEKLRDGEIFFLDTLASGHAKTKDAKTLLKNITSVKGFERAGYVSGKRTLFLVPEANPNAVRSFKNIPSAHVEEGRNVNPLLALTYKYIVIVDPKKSLAVIGGRVAGKKK